MNNAQSATIIKNSCKSKAISVSTLLTDCHIRKSLIYDMEKRDKTPSAEILEQIADYLDCSVDYLLGRTSIPEVNRPTEDVRVFKIAARDGEKEIELTAAQRAEIARIVENSKNDDNSDLF
ncbi:MAG: helix-turn-helix domain-containing protein [Lachnospiraceae bacterium]